MKKFFGQLLLWGGIIALLIMVPPLAVVVLIMWGYELVYGKDDEGEVS